MSKKGKKRRKQINFIFWASMAVIIVSIVIALIIIMSKGGKNSSSSTAETKEVQSEAKYIFNKVSDITINLSDCKAVLNYGNNDTNKDYIQYIFKLADSKEVLFESKKLKPGEILGDVSFTLPSGMKAGVYDVKVYIDNYDSEKSSESTQGIIQQIKLTIK